MPARRSARDAPGWPGRIAPVAAGGMLVGLLAAGWHGLWHEAPGARVALAAAAGFAPAVVASLRLRFGGLWAALATAAAAVVALGAAAGSDPVRVVSGDRRTWSLLGDVIPNGLGNAATTPLPLEPDRGVELGALLLIVLACASCLVAWQATVARRPLAALVVVAAGLAYRWTLVPPDHAILTGLATLAVALVAFRLASPALGGRHAGATPGRAVVLGAAVVAVAALGSAGADGAPAAWWNWQSWTLGTGRAPTSLDVAQRYGPLVYPDDPVVVMRVQADQPAPLRAVTLEDFDGLSFTQARRAVPKRPAGRGIILTADRSGDPATLTERITLAGMRTSWLLAGGRPTAVRDLGGRDVSELPDGSVRLDPAAGPNRTYEVDTLIPDPGTRALLAAGPYREGDVDPRLLQMSPGQGVPPVSIPLWGSSATRPDAAAFGQYAGVYRLSRRVIGGVRTPYEAVNRVEAYLRGPRYAYDDLAPQPAGNADLVEFALVTHRGYCQHFAGTMALMLRMNGIPARVAVGFTTDSGRYDPDTRTYEILDRDAHSWVEVHFPGAGWLPFDPTPGRSVPNAASVSSPSYSIEGLDPGSDAQVSAEPVAPVAIPGALRNEPRVPEGASPGGGGGNGPLPWLGTVAAALLAGLTAPLAIKAVRRSRRRRGDERAQVLGAARELESLARDAGLPIDPALSPRERAQALWRTLGIDAHRIYGLASAARFGPGEPPPGSGREAWAELARARRSLGWARRARAQIRLRSLRR